MCEKGKSGIYSVMVEMRHQPWICESFGNGFTQDDIELGAEKKSVKAGIKARSERLDQKTGTE